MKNSGCASVVLAVDPAIALTPSSPKVVKQRIAAKPPRLNERLFIGSYQSSFTLEEHAAVIRRCGLVAEIEAADGVRTRLYAARRRDRNSHD